MIGKLKLNNLTSKEIVVNTRIHNIKRSIVTLFCLLFSMGAMAQAYSSGGGSATNYKSTIGYNNTVTGNYSLAAGWGCQATGQTSFALGYYSKAAGLNSLALGMEVAEHGISLGEMNAILLEKVEELTRYVIDLQKQIDEMRQHNEEMK